MGNTATVPSDRPPRASEIVSFADLAPGFYQIASPQDIHNIECEVTLREADHFWGEIKNINEGGGQWVKRTVALHTSTPGLLIQAEALGVHAVSRITEMDRQRVHVVARGFRIGPDGLLEVIERSKEYDLAAELMKAALKEVQRTKGTPAEPQTTALVKTATEETALALVSTLPPTTKAAVMQARLEVQTHREALCRTKAENQVLRYFVAKAGGVLKAKPGIGQIKVVLIRNVLIRRLDAASARAAAESIFGPAESVTTTRPQTPPQAEAEQPPDDLENGHVVEGEVIHDQPEETEPPEEAEAPPEAEEPAPGDAPDEALDGPMTAETRERLVTAARAFALAGQAAEHTVTLGQLQNMSERQGMTMLDVSWGVAYAELPEAAIAQALAESETRRAANPALSEAAKTAIRDQGKNGPTKPDLQVCQGCGEPKMREKNAQYCRDHPQFFSGKLLCWECQKKLKDERNAAQQGGEQ